MRYEEWNQKIARHFFNEAKANQRVFLSVDEAFITKLGDGEGVADFIQAINEGPSIHLKHARGPCSKARVLADNRRDSKSTEHPPYIAYLALFVLAASDDDDIERGYHKRLCELLGLPPKYAGIAGFREMIGVWDDLERWTCHDLGGGFGLFQVEFSGNLMHVGIPISQTILTDRERMGLPMVFNKAGLDPEDEVSDFELIRASLQAGQGILLRRTLRRLERRREAKDESFHSLLLESLRDVLAKSADGDFSNFGTAPSAPKTKRLRLCMRHDLSGSHFSLRIKFGEDWEGGNVQVTLGSGIAAECEIGGQGWSSPLISDGQQVDGAQMDWANGDTEITTDLDDTKVKFPESRFRLFNPGGEVGLNGYIEVGRLFAGRPFHITIGPDAPEIQQWGESECSNWQQLGSTGLPVGWNLFKADEAKSTDAIEIIHPALSLPSQASIRLVGGIKLGQSSKYLDLSPPSLAVEASTLNYELKLNGEILPDWNRLEPSEFPPEKLKESNVITLEKTSGQGLTKNKRFSLIKTADIRWKDLENFGASGLNGLMTEEQPEAYVSGGMVNRLDVPDFPRIEGLHSSFDRATFVGSVPGQIQKSNANTDLDWDPCWVIESKRRSRRVFFCGLSVDSSKPQKKSLLSKKQIKQWKKLIFNDRMKLIGPRNNVLAGLWRQYQHAAKNA